MPQCARRTARTAPPYVANTLSGNEGAANGGVQGAGGSAVVFAGAAPPVRPQRRPLMVRKRQRYAARFQVFGVSPCVRAVRACKCAVEACEKGAAEALCGARRTLTRKKATYRSAYSFSLRHKRYDAVQKRSPRHGSGRWKGHAARCSARCGGGREWCRRTIA